MGERTIHSKYLFKDLQVPDDYFPPIIIADSIKTPENLGNILRLADNTRCKKVFFVETDPNIRLSKIKKTASSSFNSVDWKFCTMDELIAEIPPEYSLTAIETASDSVNVYNTTLPKKVAFIVGNEISGIRDEFLDKSDKIVHIPVLGNNTSLNVSHALAVVLFEWQRKMI